MINKEIYYKKKKKLFYKAFIIYIIKNNLKPSTEHGNSTRLLSNITVPLMYRIIKSQYSIYLLKYGTKNTIKNFSMLLFYH